MRCLSGDNQLNLGLNSASRKFRDLTDVQWARISLRAGLKLIVDERRSKNTKMEEDEDSETRNETAFDFMTGPVDANTVQ